MEIQPQVASVSVLNTEGLKNLVRNFCRSHGFNFDLIAGIITVESNWHPKRARYERQYTYLYQTARFAKVHGIPEETEVIFQKTSWGLMQVMGASAREGKEGYIEWLPDLCDPMRGVIWGCNHFQTRCSQYLDIKDQIAAYNAGSVRRRPDGSYENQGYVDAVMAALKKNVSLTAGDKSSDQPS